MASGKNCAKELSRHLHLPLAEKKRPSTQRYGGGSGYGERRNLRYWTREGGTRTDPLLKKKSKAETLRWNAWIIFHSTGMDVRKDKRSRSLKKHRWARSVDHRCSPQESARLSTETSELRDGEVDSRSRKNFGSISDHLDVRSTEAGEAGSSFVEKEENDRSND